MPACARSRDAGRSTALLLFLENSGWMFLHALLNQFPCALRGFGTVVEQ